MGTKEQYVKIVRVGISRYYGFVDASFVEIAWVYGNGKPVNKPHEYLGAYRHSTDGVEYAKFCGIKSEANLYKLEGKLVNFSFETQQGDEYFSELEYIGLGKPENFKKHMNEGSTQPFYYFYYANNQNENEINWDEKFVVGNAN